MHKRKLLIGLATAGLLLAGFGAATMPASAEQRTLLVTLLGGAQVTVTVDVAPGTPTDQIQIPGVSAPIVSVQDVTPRARAGARAGGAPGVGAGRPQRRPEHAGAEPPSSSGSSQQPAGSPNTPTQEPQAGVQSAQQTTGKAAKAQAPVDAVKKAKDDAAKKAKDAADKALQDAGLTQPDGQPTLGNPTFSEALPGPAPIGVPNFFIDKFRIPPFLLPIYQAAGIEYGVRWEVLAAINEIETDYGRNLNVSTAGAVGWMQFMPSTWKRYGVDANHDGRKDPYNPVDAIFAAARYLKAAGADQDVRGAIFAYNHADWYVDSVLMRARLIGGLPADLVGSLTGLTQGHFPVHAKARYADDIADTALANKRIKTGNAAVPVTSSSTPQGDQHLRRRRLAGDRRAGRQDREDGAHRPAGQVHPAARRVRQHVHVRAPEEALARLPGAQGEDGLRRPGQEGAAPPAPKKDPKPTAPASAGTQVKPKPRAAAAARGRRGRVDRRARHRVRQGRKERLFANPNRPAAYGAGGEEQLLDAGSVLPGYTTFKSYFTGVYGLKRSDVVLKKLKPGSKVIAGTILGRIGRTAQKMAPHMLFEIRPAGRGAPRIDPKPILDGWKLLESTAIYRAAGKNPFWGPDAKNPSIGQILLMSKEALQRRVLTDPAIDIYDCGRRDIKAGDIDRRVLATLEFLVGQRPASRRSPRCTAATAT